MEENIQKWRDQRAEVYWGEVKNDRNWERSIRRNGCRCVRELGHEVEWQEENKEQK